MPNQRKQIRMTREEVEAFLREERTAVLCSMHPSGTIHAVAMWYAFLDGDVAFETKAKSQKVQNLRRDPRITCLVEAGEQYDELRGVELVGTADVIDDPNLLWDFGVSMYERYVGPYRDDQREGVEAMIKNRVVIRLHTERMVSWDHRKLAAG